MNSSHFLGSPGKNSMKGTVYIRRSILINCFVGNCPFPAINGYHHKRTLHASALLRSNVCIRNRCAEWRDEQKYIYGIPFNRTSWAYRCCTVQIHCMRAYSVAESVLRCSVYWPNRLGQCQNVGTKDAENVHAPLVMVFIWGRKRTLTDKTVYQNGSIDTSFDLPLCSLAMSCYIFLQTAIAMKDIFRNSSPQILILLYLCVIVLHMFILCCYTYTFLASLYQLAVLEVVSQWKYSSW